MNTKKLNLWRCLFIFSLMLTLGAVSSVQAAVKVRVQPNGNTFATSYTIVGENRTYFGNVINGAGTTFEYMWDFSDGTSTGWADVADPSFISVNHTFVSPGSRWARLTSRDKNNTPDSDSATVEVEVLAVDTDGRKVNSAIDRGLRWLYLNKTIVGDSARWGTNDWVGSTGMALIAFTNHKHNLDSPDDDIYKKCVEMAIEWLFDNCYEVGIGDQLCIGDPEGVPGDPLCDDGDLDNDSVGIVFSDNGDGDSYSTENYEIPIAMLGIVNSCSKANSLVRTVTSISSPFVDGKTLHELMIQCKDFLLYSMTDFAGTGGGEGEGEGCAPCNTEWAYGDAANWPSLTFRPFFEWRGGWGCGNCMLDQPAVLHLIDDDIYIDIEFTDWECCQQGGFQYERATEGVPGEQIWTGAPIFFTKPTNSDPNNLSNGDGITPSTHLTRGLGGGGIYNLVCENDWYDPAPCPGEEVEDCQFSGWRYGRNDSSIDNSFSQWPTMALEEGKLLWDINVNPKAYGLLDAWLRYSKCTDGSWGYSSANDWCNPAKAGAGLAMLKWLGIPITDPDAQSALGLLVTKWPTTCSDGNFGGFYAMYAIYKGLRFMGVNSLNGGAIIWQDEYNTYLVNNQQASGSWAECGFWLPHAHMETSFALAMLAPDVGGLPPVANADGPYGPVNPGQNVPLDGSLSVHQNPLRNLVLYQWDFDNSDGLWMDLAPAPGGPGGAGAIGINPAGVSYPDTGSDELYTVTLRVTDDDAPAATDDDTSTVEVNTGNVPPVAQTNGPWVSLPNQVVMFDGTSSFDTNACPIANGPPCLDDSIVSYEWDIDGDGNFNEANGDDGTQVVPGDYSVVQKSFPNPDSFPVSLRVTDSFGASNTSAPQLNIVSVALVFGQAYNTCWRTLQGRFIYTDGVEVIFENQGNATAENVVMTLVDSPTNVTILGDTVNLGDVPPLTPVSSACDANAVTADIILQTNRRVPAAGGWSWKAEFDFLGQHYILNNIPPIGP